MICLTFDTDWMSETGMDRFLREMPIPGKGTFFLHSPFCCLAGSPHELCPHPFIEKLAQWREALASVAAGLPQPVRGVRPHSCVFSHMIGVGLHDMGYRYISQATNLFQCNLAPHRHPWGIWELPIYYMDNMDFCLPTNWPALDHQPFSRAVIREAVEGGGLHVFDFHPLHIALNTRRFEDYARVKQQVLAGVSPFDLAFSGRGARTFYLELCEAMDDAGVRSEGCWDALRRFGCE